MPDIKLGFFDSHHIPIEFSHEGEALAGQLILGPNSSILRVELDGERYPFFIHKDGLCNAPLVCKEQGERRYFTLLGCDWKGGSIYPEFVVSGEHHHLEKFDLIEVHLTGLSTWFEQFGRSEVTDLEFKRDVRVDRFAVNFDFEDERYSLENSRRVLARTPKSGHHVVEVQDYILVRKKSGDFTIDDVKKLSCEVRDIFSLLTGNVLSISQVCLSFSQNNRIRENLLFNSFVYEQVPLDHYFSALCPVKYLFSWDVWETVVNNYFQNRNFHEIWKRLVQAMSKSDPGYWEFGVLYVVCVFELYSENYVKQNQHKIKPVKLRELKNSLMKCVDDYVESNNFSRDDIGIIEGVKTAISNIRNTSTPTLVEKFNTVLGEVDEEILKIFDFDDNDFSILKRIRDSVSHGRDYAPCNVADITKEITIKNKLLSFLLYFLLKDFGFNDRQISTFFSIGFHHVVRSADLNERALDKLSGRARFILIEGSVCWEKLGSKSDIVIFYNRGLNEFYIDENLTNELRKSWRNSGIKDCKDFVRSKVNQDVECSVEFIGKCYLRDSLLKEGEEIRILSVVLVSIDN